MPDSAECCSSHAAAGSPALGTFAITTTHLLSVDNLEWGWSQWDCSGKQVQYFGVPCSHGQSWNCSASKTNNLQLCVWRVVFFPINKMWPLQVLLFWHKHDVYTNWGTSVLVLLIPNKVIVTGPFPGTYSVKFIMQQCKKMNSLDQILTTVVNFGHLMDFAGSVPRYTRKWMGSFSSFIPCQDHHHVYFILF